METSEILKKVRKIEIKARGLSANVFAGQYHSAFKGRGMAFSEVREYQYGDDVRDIDWNVTARFHRPYVKVFEEERELTVILMIDVSGSLDFGTQKQMKRTVGELTGSSDLSKALKETLLRIKKHSLEMAQKDGTDLQSLLAGKRTLQQLERLNISFV